MRQFLLGMYAAASVVVFLIVAVLVMLTGDSSELWRAPVYAAAWPLLLLWVVLTWVGGIFFGN